MNSDREKQQLAARYSNMAEGELREIAEHRASLTEEALHALNAEIDRRGYDIPIDTSPAGIDVVEQQKLVTIRQFRDMPEAVLAKGLLESAGIECFFADDNLVRLDWFMSNAIGGIKLQVKPEDVAAANEILEQPIPENFEVDGIGEYEQPHCPRCQSLDLTFNTLQKPISYASAWVGVPIPVHAKGWRCTSCGNEWESSASEDTAGQ